MAAIIVTSLLRRRIGRRPWRAVHWLAYVSWPVALAHSIGSSTDMRSGPLLDLAVVCTLAVLAATAWRVAGTLRAVPRAGQTGVRPANEHALAERRVPACPRATARD